MCGPLTLAAASTVTAFIGQRQAAKANEQAANVTAHNAYNEQQQRNVQIDANQSESTLNNLIAQRATQGRISSSAAALGVDNSTAEGLFQSSDFASGREQSINDLNSQNLRVQSDNNIRGIEIQRISDINRVQKPSAASLILGLGKDVNDSVSDAIKMSGGLG